MKKYDPKGIEKKWQTIWEKKKLNVAQVNSRKKKYYALVEFPYPSGQGLHTGHIRSYTALDVVARKRRAEGYNVLYPMGWDAFGLPTENYAIKTGIHPKIVTKKNTDTFRRQMQALGFSFDWSREINTTDPAYYKWTQWIFLQFLKQGLAYKARTLINWCPKDKIGLADEEVIQGACERCGTQVEKREKEQWMMAITKYAERLNDDLDSVNFEERIKIQQRNWIGKSEGSEIDFEIKGMKEKVSVFTTRVDTIFGATYLVLAPEHPLVQKLSPQIKNFEEVKKYITAAKNKSDIDRTAEGKEKTGVELKGIVAINPANKKEIPVYVADYALAHYGTGALMAVPAHDERDQSFAKKFKLPMPQVIEPKFVATQADKGDAAVKPELPFVKRDAICAIVRNPKDDTYLCISWKTVTMHGLVTGGIDEGEDVVEAARREIKEETGYKNLKHIERSTPIINTYFYHRVKKENRWARFHYVFFDLVDDSRVEIDEKEKALHEVVWKKKSEFKGFFTVFEGDFITNLIDNSEYIYTGEGILVNSGKFDGLDSHEAKKEITKFVEGKTKTTFKLRDWVFSRQRYWGEPIPVIHCPDCGIVPVPEKDLPVELPNVKSYKPGDDGESPLANISSWVNVKCPSCKGKAKRETDVMPNWAGSSWYYLRYADPKNKKAFASKQNLKYWIPVDWYNGGMEHTVLHLLYSRFWHKFLYDIKLVPTKEPYMKRTSHGLILAEGGVKMSKSVGNVVNPDSIVKLLGADSLRHYEMFMGPFEQAIAWNGDAITGSRRYIERVFKLFEKVDAPAPRNAGRAVTVKRALNEQLEVLFNQTIKKVSEDIEGLKMNTALSQLMILLNAFEKEAAVSRTHFSTYLRLLAPFTPHVTEELWAALGEKSSIHLEPWPKWDTKKLLLDRMTIPVQINGKTKTTLLLSRALDDDQVQGTALANPEVLKLIAGKKIKKVIYIKERIINIVI